MATLSDLYAHLKTLCEQWFYNKSTTDTFLSAKLNVSDVDSSLSSSSSNPVQNKVINSALSGKASSSHSHGNITNAGAVGSTANKPLITTTNGVVTTGSFGTSANTFCQGNDSRLSDARTPTAHNQASSTITEANALSNIGTSAGATQQAINSALDTKIGSLAQIDAVQVVTTLPTASSSTMGGLYIINENSKVNVYYTEESSGSYSWHKMDTDILDELSIAWSDVQNKPTSFTPASHTHGQLTNDGKITSSAVTVASGDNIVITDASDSSIVKRVANLLSSHIKDSSAYANLGTSASATQSAINSAINTKIGELGTGSFTELQALITGASSGDTIVLDRDYRNTGSEAQITIDKTLTIVGNGHTIDADNVSRCINISASDVVLTGLYFVNGNATVYDSNKHGGGVYCPTGSTVTITDCHFNDCSATSGGGGALLSSSTLSDCSFTDCSADYGGGALLSSSTVYDSIFNDCTATDGGGIYSYSNTQVYGNTLNNSTLYNVTNKPYLTEVTSHSHGNITNDGKVTVTGSNGGNLVVTNSSNAIVVESAIDVLDGVVQSLITYGSS